MKHLNFLSNFRWFTTVILLITFGIGQIWGTETICKTLDFSDSDFRSGNGTTSQTTTWTATKSTTTWSIYGFHNNNWNSSWTKIRAGSKKSNAGDAAKTGTGTISTSFSCSEAITKVVVTTASCAATNDRKLTGTKLILASNSTFTENVVEYAGPTTATSNEMTFTVTTPTANRYYKLSFTWYNNTTSTPEVIEVSKVEYYYQEASCTVNPTAGAASLNGSISLSSLPVQTTGWTVGSNCEWSDFGFVWSTSVSTPTLESNGTASTNCTKIQKATSGTATSTSHSITGTFSVGATYYVRGYGKNRYASGTYQYTSVMTITPRSITFNSNGGSSVSTIYVNSGTAASAPTAPTKTGYTFGGWYTDNGTFASAVNWSSTISENKTYYAKWTAKTTTVSFNQNSGTGGQTSSVTATYDAAMPSAPVTCPTRTGYDFGGYYDGTGGTGTQYYTSTGASARTWNKENATWTLYAKWTVKSFTVTWMVNGVAYTTGDPSNSVDFGSHVAKLPTAPTPPCGDKFMGWTTTNIGATGQATDTGLNLFTTADSAPTISAEGNVTYYAVFADYAD